MLKKNFGILTVEEVSEGFMQLVENCGNGAAVIVFKVLYLFSLITSIDVCFFINLIIRERHRWCFTTSVFLLFTPWPSYPWLSIRWRMIIV